MGFSLDAKESVVNLWSLRVLSVHIDSGGREIGGSKIAYVKNSLCSVDLSIFLQELCECMVRFAGMVAGSGRDQMLALS